MIIAAEINYFCQKKQSITMNAKVQFFITTSNRGLKIDALYQRD